MSRALHPRKSVIDALTEITFQLLILLFFTIMMAFRGVARTVLLISLCLALVWPHGSLAKITSAKITSSKQRLETNILVVGSINLDLIVSVDRIPSREETITSRRPSPTSAVGGKGANQCLAVAKLSSTSSATSFLCRFGNDQHAEMLKQTLLDAGVDISGSSTATNITSGLGIVLLEPDGTASSIVLGGSNTAWDHSTSAMDHLFTSSSYRYSAVMLQQEIPDKVNLLVAQAAHKAGIPIMLDVGGEDRPLSATLVSLIDYIAPNESELHRLTGLPTSTETEVVTAAKILLKQGCRNVLVTLGDRGSLLIRGDGSILRQPALPIPGGKVVDATAAGDAFRAGFMVALVEGRGEEESLLFGAAAGAFAVSKMGAAPSLPGREDIVTLVPSLALSENDDNNGKVSDNKSCSNNSRGECSNVTSDDDTDAADDESTIAFPYKFASRLNSMRARRDLIKNRNSAEGKDTVLGWIARQGQIKGLDLVDLNYPQHFDNGLTEKKLCQALDSAGLAVGAIAIRFPEKDFSLGAFSNPNDVTRQKAVDIAVEGCRWAAKLGGQQLIIWSPYDGYDYPFQVDYGKAWQWTVDSFQKLADSCPPGIRVSLEFKPTDESSRFSIVPSTGAALLLSNQVNRPNFGLTLDLGHLLMAGENPAQSVAIVASAGKLFGIQLNDAHVKLGAEDGLAFGSVNPRMALEVVYYLRRLNYKGHIYYDTFPKNEDPVREAEYNIRMFKKMWRLAGEMMMAGGGIEEYMAHHDAMGVLELLENIV